MSRHARKKPTALATVLTTAVIASASLVGLNAAFATTLNVAQQPLAFDKGAAPGGTPYPIVQTAGDGSPSLDIGAGMAVNDVIHYTNIATVDGTQIDARITVTAESGIGGAGATDGLLYKLDDATSSGDNKRINSDLLFNVTTGDSYVEYTIEFLTGLTTTAGSGSSVTLQNFVMSTYDIDSYQYVEVNGVTNYYFGPGTILTAQDMGSGVTRFVETNGISSSSSNMNSRVTMEFGSASTIVMRLGQNVLSGTESNASYQLDFSTGVSWGAVVTYNSNDESATTTTQAAPGTAALAANTFERPGYIFSGWNTQPDGSGTAYADGASYNFRSSMTLYAQWSEAPAPQPYTGPIPIRLSPSIIDSETARKVALAGERLNTVTSAEIDGRKIEVSNVTETSLTLSVPALEPGTYDVKYFSGNGTLTHQDSLIVRETQRVVAVANNPFFVAKRFTNYRGDRGPVVATDRAAITAFINANPGLTHVTCVGSTSGVPAIETDEALATARAENACSIVKELVPGVTTKIATSTGLGVGQWYRAVSIFGKGQRD